MTCELYPTEIVSNLNRLHLPAEYAGRFDKSLMIRFLFSRLYPPPVGHGAVVTLLFTQSHTVNLCFLKKEKRLSYYLVR